MDIIAMMVMIGMIGIMIMTHDLSISHVDNDHEQWLMIDETDNDEWINGSDDVFDFWWNNLKNLSRLVD